MAWHLTLLLVRAHRCIEAESLLIRRIEPLGEPKGAAVLDRAVFRCRIDEARIAESIGTNEEAEQILQRVAARARDPELKAIVETQLERLHRDQKRGLSRKQVTDQSNAAVTSFARAVKAANAGRYDEAIQILRQERDTTWQEDLLDRSRRMETTLLARKQLSEAIVRVNAGDLTGAKDVLARIRTVDLDDSTLAKVERMRQRTEARLAIHRGVQRVQRGRLSPTCSKRRLGTGCAATSRA